MKTSYQLSAVSRQNQARPTPQPPMVHGIDGGVAPEMISSLPSQASGADAYLRQFYRGSRVPFRRYLPVRAQ